MNEINKIIESRIGWLKRLATVMIWAMTLIEAVSAIGIVFIQMDTENPYVLDAVITATPLLVMMVVFSGVATISFETIFEKESNQICATIKRYVVDGEMPESTDEFDLSDIPMRADISTVLSIANNDADNKQNIDIDISGIDDTQAHAAPEPVSNGCETVTKQPAKPTETGVVHDEPLSKPTCSSPDIENAANGPAANIAVENNASAVTAQDDPIKLMPEYDDGEKRFIAMIQNALSNLSLPDTEYAIGNPSTKTSLYKEDGVWFIHRPENESEERFENIGSAGKAFVSEIATLADSASSHNTTVTTR